MIIVIVVVVLVVAASFWSPSFLTKSNLLNVLRQVASSAGIMAVGMLYVILTRGIDLLGLPTGTVLRIGAAAVLRVTGLRNPCAQLDRFRPGLMAATLGRDAQGNLVALNHQTFCVIK